MKFLPIMILARAIVFSLGFGDISVADTCSIESDCMKCLSRTSQELERCHQLYFYVTYTNTGNQREINRYCTGECPIILITATVYCVQYRDINKWLKLCPTYSYKPTGSMNIRYNEQCSSPQTSSRTFNCLSHDNREALKCTQLFYLAYSQNYTNTYMKIYCEGNCPTLMSTFGWYGGGGDDVSSAYGVCLHNGNDYCGSLKLKYQMQIWSGASMCKFSCTHTECQSAINKFGCCLREEIGDTCPTIPKCELHVNIHSRSFNLTDHCPVTGCSQCLARGLRKLEQCQQRFSFLSYVDSQIKKHVLFYASARASANHDYCSSDCPALMSTSKFYCSGIQASRVTDSICPSYNFVPRASTEVTATYGSQQTCTIHDNCAECIGSRSPEVNKCQQLYSLTFHPNQSSFYLNKYCSSNCPLTLGTAGWYCGSVSIEETFNRCRQWNNAGSRDFCESLILTDSSQYHTAVSNCISDCTSAECRLAKNTYGCCLNSNPTIERNCGIPECDIMTAGSPPVMATCPTDHC